MTSTSRFGTTKYGPPQRWLAYWAPAGAWLLVVAIFSSQVFGVNSTGGMLRVLLGILHVNLPPDQFQALHYLVRKCAHFTAYGILSALFFRALRASDLSREIWKSRYALITLAVCLVTSSGDEVHQAFTPGRTGNWHDVVLDMLGATFVQLAMLFVLQTRRAQARWLASRDGVIDNNSIAAATRARLAER